MLLQKSLEWLLLYHLCLIKLKKLSEVQLFRLLQPHNILCICDIYKVSSSNSFIFGPVVKNLILKLQQHYLYRPSSMLYFTIRTIKFIMLSTIFKTLHLLSHCVLFPELYLKSLLYRELLLHLKDF